MEFIETTPDIEVLALLLAVLAADAVGAVVTPKAGIPLIASLDISKFILVIALAELLLLLLAAGTLVAVGADG